MSWRAIKDWRRWSLANSSGWPWRQKKKEEQDWRMLQLPETAQVGHGARPDLLSLQPTSYGWEQDCSNSLMPTIVPEGTLLLLCSC